MVLVKDLDLLFVLNEAPFNHIHNSIQPHSILKGVILGKNEH